MTHIELALLFAPQDMMLIFAIGFLLFGPKRLPEIGEALGKTVRAFREGSSKMMEELSKETRASRHEELESHEHDHDAIDAHDHDALAPSHGETGAAALEPPSSEHEPKALQAEASEDAIWGTVPETSAVPVKATAEPHPHVEVVHGEVIPEETPTGHAPQAEVLNPSDGLKP